MQIIRTVIAALMTGLSLLSTAYFGYWNITYKETVHTEYETLMHTVFNDNGVLTPVVKKMPDITTAEYIIMNYANRKYLNEAVKEVLVFESKYGSRGQVAAEDGMKYGRAVEIIRAYREIPEKTDNEEIRKKYAGYIDAYETALKNKVSGERINEVSELAKWDIPYYVLIVSMAGTLLLVLKMLGHIGKLIYRIIGGTDEEDIGED